MGPKMITFLHVDLEGAVCPDQGEEGGDDGQAPAGQHHHPHHRLFIAELLVRNLHARPCEIFINTVLACSYGPR